MEQGKLLIMASPRMRQGFILLDPARIPRNLYSYAATIRGALRLGEKIPLRRLKSIHVDIMITGSVAVDRHGNRLGKGEGYAEIEYAVLKTIGSITEDTPVATTIHELQLVPEIPREPYDLTVDIIATPRRIIRINPRPPKPPGIIWELLPAEKLAEIPVLRELMELEKRGR